MEEKKKKKGRKGGRKKEKKRKRPTALQIKDINALKKEKIIMQVSFAYKALVVWCQSKEEKELTNFEYYLVHLLFYI